MEYAKDILIGVKQGQVERKNARKGKKNKSLNFEGKGFKSFTSKIIKHKFIISIALAIISFIALDLFLISNFINILSSI